MLEQVDYLSFIEEPIEQVILRDDFKKSVAFNKANSIAYLTAESTIEKIIKMLFEENSKNNSSEEPINRFIDVYSFTSKIALGFVKSQRFCQFINEYLDSSYINYPYYNNILEKIVNKMVEVDDDGINDEQFVSRTKNFCDNLYKYTHIYPLCSIFINLTCYHSAVFGLTKETIKYLLEVATSNNINNSYDTFSLLTRLVKNKNTDKRAFKESEQIFDYSEIIAMITKKTTPGILKLVAIEFLSGFKEFDLNNKFKDTLLSHYNELGDQQTKVRSAILELIGTLPDDYCSILFDKPPTTITNYVFTELNKIYDSDLKHFERLVLDYDLIGKLQDRYKSSSKDSVETNPFPLKIAELIFKIPRFNNDPDLDEIKRVTQNRLDLKLAKIKKPTNRIESISFIPTSKRISFPLMNRSFITKTKAITPGLATFANQKKTWIVEC